MASPVHSCLRSSTVSIGVPTGAIAPVGMPTPVAVIAANTTSVLMSMVRMHVQP